jgi:anti-anti-sigma regulatory factor
MADRSVEVFERAGVSIVVVQGELTSDRVDFWRLLAELSGPIVIDCARIPSADGSALSALGGLRSDTAIVILRRVQNRLRELLDDHDLSDLVAYAEREDGRGHDVASIGSGTP